MKTHIELNVATARKGDVVQFLIVSTDTATFSKGDAKKIKTATVKALRAEGFAVQVTGNIEIR